MMEHASSHEGKCSQRTPWRPGWIVSICVAFYTMYPFGRGAPLYQVAEGQESWWRPGWIGPICVAFCTLYPCWWVPLYEVDLRIDQARHEPSQMLHLRCLHYAAGDVLLTPQNNHIYVYAGSHILLFEAQQSLLWNERLQIYIYSFYPHRLHPSYLGIYSCWTKHLMGGFAFRNSPLPTYAKIRLVSARTSSSNVFIISMDPSRTSIVYSNLKLIMSIEIVAKLNHILRSDFVMAAIFK